MVLGGFRSFHVLVTTNCHTMDAHPHRTELPLSRGKVLQNDVKNNQICENAQVMYGSCTLPVIGFCRHERKNRFQGCARLWQPGGPGPQRLTVAPGRPVFSQKSYAGHPGFPRFGAVGSIQFFLQHSLGFQSYMNFTT